MFNQQAVFRKDFKKEYFLDSNFFYGFQFNSKNLKKSIKNYIIELENCTKCHLHSFSNLFKSFDFSYPVKVSGSFGNLQLITSDEEIFEVCFPANPTIYGDFSVWKNVQNITFVSYYNIIGNNRIVLREAKICPINPIFKTLEPYFIKVIYNDNFTTIEFYNYSSIIKIIYLTQSDEIDEQIINQLLQLSNSTSYMYNIYSTFCNILDIKCDFYNFSISSIGENNDILSEINISEDGIVTSYSYTEIKNDDELFCNTFHFIPNMTLAEFVQ